MKTKVRMEIYVQTEIQRETSKFLYACDFGVGDVVQKKILTFTTESNVDAKYIERMKEHMIGKQVGDLYIQGVGEVSIMM